MFIDIILATGSEASPTATKEESSNEIFTNDEDFVTTDTELPTTLLPPDTTVTPEQPNFLKAWEQTERPTHPCLRPCVPGQVMICHYHFAVEWYYAMSKACHNCSHNVSDCYRQDCIPANGIKRPLIVVNKLLPGPSIEVNNIDQHFSKNFDNKRYSK